MADNHNHFYEGGSRDFSDEAIRRFLLGALSASDRPSFEQRLIADDDLDARVRVAEFDLADDYAFERLNTIDRQLFEQKFLLTSGRQQQVHVSKALRDRFSSPATWSEEQTVTRRLRELFGLSRPAWRIAFGVVILLILFGTTWLVIREPRIVRQIANQLTPRRSPQRGLPRAVNHPFNQSSPEHRTTPAPMPEHDQTASSPVVVTITLRPAALPQASEMPALNLPKGDQDGVRLQLASKPDQTGPFRAELLTIEGSSVLSADSLKPNDSGVEIDFDVPVRLLKTGSYQVKLSRVDGDSKRSVASYYFRVQ